MDRALIERMIGATVLVLLLVIVAPAVLDGSRQESLSDGDSPSGDRVRTEVIVLNESGERSSRIEPADQAEAETSVREAELIAVPEPVSEPPREQAAAAAPAVKVASERQEAGAQDAVRAAGGFAVQLGSFREQANASQFADKIKGKGFPVFVQSAGSPAGPVYRVYAGPRPTRDAAEKLTATLAKAGYDGMVIDMSSN
ncbi:MAG: SPOR domain-containing protein [Gammaproteobacteria bacterium]|jgi:DedD protein